MPRQSPGSGGSSPCRSPPGGLLPELASEVSHRGIDGRSAQGHDDMADQRRLISKKGGQLGFASRPNFDTPRVPEGPGDQN